MRGATLRVCSLLLPWALWLACAQPTPTTPQPQRYQTARRAGARYSPICRRVGDTPEWDCDAFVDWCHWVHGTEVCETIHRAHVPADVIAEMRLGGLAFGWRVQSACNVDSGMEACADFVEVCARDQSNTIWCVTELEDAFRYGTGFRWRPVERYTAPPTTRTGGGGGGPVQVRGYYRHDGTYVRPHTRRRPRR